MSFITRTIVATVVFLSFAVGARGEATPTPTAPRATKLLNVSYDPTRELYEELNTAFARAYKEKGFAPQISQSHGGSGKQARSVIDGLEADVVTLALAYDVEQLVAAKRIAPGWQGRLPYNSAPYTSTIVFLVRAGNPKQIHDWDDLIKPGVEVITPNPKTSGGARWNYLAAWGFAERHMKNEMPAQEFITRLFANVPVLDSGARSAATTFVQREIGDVLIAWESEALFISQSFGKGKAELVMPSISIAAEAPVALVDENVAKHDSRELAEAYLQFHFTKEAQEIFVKHFLRPRDPQVLEGARSRFSPVELLSIDKDFGGWKAAQARHFSEGGTFDRAYGIEQ